MSSTFPRPGGAVAPTSAMSLFWKSIMACLALIAGIHLWEKMFEVRNLRPKEKLRYEWIRCSKNDTRRHVLTRDSRVFVTGGAGFIGSSLMAALASRDPARRPSTIVGLDNFNPYYSPLYKRARAQRLRQEFGLPVVEGDVCNASLLEALFQRHQFTHVVHLAAQAGVRYSLTHPLSYVRNNLECFVTLVELIRKIPEKRRPSFVYASSSSVYGLNRKIPFSETDAVTSPANLYGASKFMNEQIAAAFHHIYGLQSVGLRFFTVYGPWGRPDMAAFLFTRAIETGKPLTLFNQGKMRRDFTYIDDIVDGVARSMEHCAYAATVFNLGNNHPVELMHFIETIERELGAKAQMVHKVSTAEIKETYADVRKAKAQLGYKPHTSVEDGLRSFIAWYKHEPRRHTFATGGDFNNRRRALL